MSLRGRLLLAMAALLVMLVSLVMGLWLPTWEAKEKAALLRNDHDALQVLGDALLEPLLSGELSSVHGLLDRQKKNHMHWRILELEDAFARRIYPLGEEASARDPRWQWLDQDLVSQGRYVGRLRLAVDHDALLSQRLNVVHQATLGLSLLLFLGLMVVAWLQDRWVAKPVARLSAVLDAVAQGDVLAQDPVVEVDEFRRLVDSFRSMREAIARRERELLIHRQRLQAVLDSVQDAILVVSGEGEIVDVNPAALRIFGYLREDLEGERVQRVLPEITLPGGGEGRGRRRTYTGCRHDGRRLIMEVSVSTLSGADDEVLYSVLARDVTERIEREERNRRLLSEVQAMIALVPGVVTRVDRHGVVEWCNDRLAELCGEEPQALVHRLFVDLLEDSAREVAREAMEKAGRSGEAEFQARFRGHPPSATHLFRLRRLQESDEAMVIVGMDIEAQVAVQQMLREARDQAMSLARSRFFFLANASHEIRTPLNGVLGMLELLAEHVQEAGLEYLEGARRSGENLLGLVNDLLDLSKLEAGQLQLEALDFSLFELVEDLMEMFSPKAKEKGLELSWEMDPSLPEAVRADRTRLWQVLANLLSNALKFTEKGHVLLRIRPGGRRDEVVFQVEDTGIGISAEAQKRIFAPFQQAQSDTTRRFGGTGLGLALSRQLVELMGGRLSVESRLGEGSRFTVELPLPTSTMTVPKEGVSLRGLRVLVVDDLLANRRTLETVLHRAGAQVDVAKDANEALERVHFAYADDKAYDILLLDLELPGMDGLSLLERLRRDPLLRQHPPRVILMARDLDEAVKERADRLQVDGLLNKPLRRRELLQVLMKGVNTSEAGKKARRGPVRRFQGRVLLVEDNAVNTKVAMAFLERLGVEVQAVENGEEALRAWREMRPDLILMDVQMPVMDGFTATRKIREAEGEGRRTPIVALTANALSGDEQRCLEAGMDGYLTKPLRIEALEEELARWLTEKDQSDRR